MPAGSLASLPRYPVVKMSARRDELSHLLRSKFGSPRAFTLRPASLASGAGLPH